MQIDSLKLIRDSTAYMHASEATEAQRAAAVGRALALQGITRDDGSKFGGPRKRPITNQTLEEEMATSPRIVPVRMSYEELKAQTLRAAESALPISSSPQPKPAKVDLAGRGAPLGATPQAAAVGYTWSPAGGWVRTSPDPVLLQRQYAIEAAARIQPPRPAPKSFISFAEQAHAAMKARGQSVDPKSPTYAAQYRTALMEVAARPPATTPATTSPAVALSELAHGVMEARGHSTDPSSADYLDNYKATLLEIAK